MGFFKPKPPKEPEQLTEQQAEQQMIVAEGKAFERQVERSEDKQIESARFGEGRSLDATNLAELFGKFIESKGYNIKSFNLELIPVDSQEYIAQLSEFASSEELKLSNITEDEIEMSCLPRFRLAGYCFKHKLYMTGSSFYQDLRARLSLSRSKKGWQQGLVVTMKKENIGSNQLEEKKWK